MLNPSSVLYVPDSLVTTILWLPGVSPVAV